MSYHLNSHITNNVPPLIKCSYCPSTYMHEKEKRIHEKKMHLNCGKEYNCHCGRNFTSSSSYYFHKASVHDLGDFPCTSCEKVLNSKTKLKAHEARHHGPKQPCEVCGLMVGTGKLYSEHLKCHKSIKCTVEGCNKQFTSQHVYRNHMKLEHSDQKEVPCPTCNVMYPSMFRLKKHISRQHGKQLSCEVPDCGFSTARREKIKKHYKNHKGIDITTREDLLKRLDKTKYIRE